MDKTKKILFIIFLTLSIISMTFGLCKKVGLCASSEQINPYFDDFPLPMGEGYGGDITFGEEELNAIFTLFSNFGVSQDKIYYMLMNERTDSDHYKLSVYYNDPGMFAILPEVSYSNSFPNSVIQFKGRNIMISVDAVNNVATFLGNTATRQEFLYLQYILVSSPVSGYYDVESGWILKYPKYSKFNNTITSTSNTTNILLFESADPVEEEEPPIGHTKGGNIANYVPVDDSNVDVSNVSPSSSNTTNFLQKITNLLQNLLKSTQNGFSNIVSNLQNFWNPILGWLEQTFDSLLDKIDSIIAFLTPPSISDITSAWLSYYNNSALAKFGDLFSALNDIFIQIFNASAPDTLSFTYNLPSFSLSNGFGDSYIMGRTITIDFGWYNNVRDSFISILAPLLYLSFFYMLFIKIPGIIGGSSGPVQSLVKTGKSK